MKRAYFLVFCVHKLTRVVTPFSAKDKTILEEAYKANPKPDKQARLDIVNRVSLNEKEVQVRITHDPLYNRHAIHAYQDYPAGQLLTWCSQIWFQNRRQNDRRKSRPLSPEELAALRFNGLHGVSTDPMAVAASISNAQSPAPLPAHTPANPQAVSPPQTSAQLAASATQLLTATPRASGPANPPLPETTPQNRELSSSQSSQDVPSSVAHPFSSSVGYLANRWNIGSALSTPAGQTRDADTSPRCVHEIHNAYMHVLIQCTLGSSPPSLVSLTQRTMPANGRANLTSDSPCPWKAKLSSLITRLPQRVPLRKNTLLGLNFLASAA